MEKRTQSDKHAFQPLKICCVCGDIARGFNFSVMTCISCKTFFRRNAHRQSILPRCELDNHCPITKITRSYCSICRLEKCFAEGMDPQMIRFVPNYQPQTKKIRKVIITKENLLQLIKPFPLGLLQNDRSTLTNEQWNLVSNIIHAYDERISIKCVARSINQMCSLPPKLRTKPSETLNIISHFFSSVQPLIEHSPHLHSLPIDARRALIKYNMYTTGTLNALFLFREFDISSNMTIMNGLIAFYGYDVAMLCVRDSQQYDPNGNLIKMLIFLLAFSGNCSIVTFDGEEGIEFMSSSIHRFKIQNVYVTVFWKYLLYLYGFEQAVIRFSSLIKRILNLLCMAEMICNHVTHTQLINNIVTETERSLIIHN